MAEMAVKTGMGHPGSFNHRDNGCALEHPFARHDYFPPIQVSLQLTNILKRKAEAGSSFVSPCSYNLASKKRWEEVSFSGSSAFTSLLQMSESGPLNIY
jgi:hypothetical protein